MHHKIIYEIRIRKTAVAYAMQKLNVRNKYCRYYFDDNHFEKCDKAMPKSIHKLCSVVHL